MNRPETGRWHRLIIAFLPVGLMLVAWFALSSGAVAIPTWEVMAVLSSKIGVGAPASSQGEAVVWGLRMPRLLLGLVVGAALGAGGTGLQGLMRNRLADPHLLGIGPGAAIGAVIGSTAGGAQGAIAGGVAAGAITVFALRRTSRNVSHDPTRVVLTGVALGLAFTAWVGFFVFAADRARVPPLEFWLLGSLSGSTWRTLGTTAVFVVIGCTVLFGMRRTLDLFSLGDVAVRQLGIDVALTRTIGLMAIGVMVGASVGATGVIVFVGLLAPLIGEWLAGPLHRLKMPVAMALGAILVASADLLARLLISPIELPVGLITSAVGGPVLFALVTRRGDG